MKRVFFFAAVLAFLASAGQSQTLANFDNPLCSGNGVRSYQGIDFSLSPWDCENAGLSGQTGEAISWYQRITSARFRFQSPQVLVSLKAATSSGSGTLTITTDAGETFVHAVTTTFQTFNTGFSRPASVVTVQFPGGWTIQLDDLTYQASTGSSGGGTVIPGTLNASGTLVWDDGTPVAGSLTFIQVIGGATQKVLGTFPISSTGFVNGKVAIDMTQPDPLTFRVALTSPTGTSLGMTSFQVLKLMFPTTATGINAKITLWKATSTIKSFEVGLTP